MDVLVRKRPKGIVDRHAGVRGHGKIEPERAVMLAGVTDCLKPPKLEERREDALPESSEGSGPTERIHCYVCRHYVCGYFVMVGPSKYPFGDFSEKWVSNEPFGLLKTVIRTSGNEDDITGIVRVRAQELEAQLSQP